jgi:hypothetical protein
MKTISYKTRDAQGNVWHHTLPGVASWADETSPYDPYTLRVMRNAQGRPLDAPIVGEFFDWAEHDEEAAK